MLRWAHSYTTLDPPQITRGKSPGQLSRVILLDNLFEDIFQSMNLETFRSREKGRRVNCEEELHAAGKQHSMGAAELLTGCRCTAFEYNLLL